VWDPREIDLAQDAEEWPRLAPDERDLLLRVTSLFQAGEESVVLDLVPLLLVIGREGRLEEELFLTAFLWEEGKHAELFRRYLDEVGGGGGDLARFHGPAYRALFDEELPRTMGALLEDASPAAQARAVVTYTIVVEGVLAETGYHGYFTALERAGVLPGLRRGLELVQRDESRHIAYGIYLLARLLHADRGLWPIVEERMNELLPAALAVVEETFAPYDAMPFGLELEEFLAYARAQFGKRYARLERARSSEVLEDV
jgi:ribonucleoside-diphosphate reductase beta chain